MNYIGMGFPLDGTVSGDFGTKPMNGVLTASLMMILGTLPGERVMLPAFGSNLQRRVFAPQDPTLAGQLVGDVVGSLATWDDRIGIDPSTIAVNPVSGGGYALTGTATNLQDPNQADFPFSQDLTSFTLNK